MSDVQYPGVYVQELTSTQPITGASTSVTAFMGRAPGGPVGQPVFCDNWGAVQASFGADWTGCPMGQSLTDFFANGGAQAVVLRLQPAEGEALTAAGLIAGLSLLDKAASVNLLVIPPDALAADVPAEVWPAAAAYCQGRNAFLLVDPPAAWTNAASAAAAQSAAPLVAGAAAEYAAVYFPNLLHDGPTAPFAFPPSGAVAGIYAATDMQVGVWKAPAGLQAIVNGITGLAVTLSDADNGELLPLGINALRVIPPVGPVVWGARTLAGADALADDYKYVPVRRLVLYIENSIRQSCQWTPFEVNGPALWTALRQDIGGFLQSLLAQGAFYGYSIACDATTTTPDDIALGLVNLVIQIAPTKPAEFLAFQIQLTAAAA